MKTPFFKHFLISTFAFSLIVGCGKEASKSSGPAAQAPVPAPVVAPPVAAPPVALPPITNSATVTTQTNMTNLKAWFAAADTVTTSKFRGTYNVVKSSGLNASASISLCFGSWGLNCKASSSTPSNCYVKNGDGVNYDVGTPDSTQPFSCKITQAAMSKATNAELAKAINGEGNLILLQASLLQTGVYVVTWGTVQLNGYPAMSKRYIVDTNLHSVLNPMQVDTTSSSSYKTNITSFDY